MNQLRFNLPTALASGVFIIAGAAYGAEEIGAVVSSHLSDAQNAFYESQESQMSKRFKELAKKWQDETWFMSNADNIARHPAYQEIVGMGVEAVPMILREMEREPDHWFWALNIINGFDVVRAEHAGNISAMTQDWLDWGRANRLV